MTHDRFIARRRLLGGAVALSAAAVAVSPALATSAHPDAEILELGRQHAEMGRRYEALCDELVVAHARADAMVGPKSDVLRSRRDDWFRAPWEIGQFYKGDQVAHWRRAVDPEGGFGGFPEESSTRARLMARGHEIVEAWDARQSEIGAADMACRIPALKAEADALGEAHYALEQRIFALQATTPEGLRVKARIAAGVIGEGPDGTYEDHLTRNLLADLLRDRPI